MKIQDIQKQLVALYSKQLQQIKGGSDDVANDDFIVIEDIDVF